MEGGAAAATAARAAVIAAVADGIVAARARAATATETATAVMEASKAAAAAAMVLAAAMAAAEAMAAAAAAEMGVEVVLMAGAEFEEPPPGFEELSGELRFDRTGLLQFSLFRSWNFRRADLTRIWPAWRGSGHVWCCMWGLGVGPSGNLPTLGFGQGRRRGVHKHFPH